MDWLGRAWRPAVEILILAIALYYALTFIRGTRGASIVSGFLFLMITSILIVTLLDLTVLGWILQKAGTVVLFAVLIIFQPELRRMLASMGNQRLFATAREQRENIEVIVQAAERLSEVRIGGLMAVEQTIQLQDVVESGIVVDCEATPEMLETIFFPNNAIHDGGVILKGDRIAYAACIFPLTQRPDLSKTLGTRHRAAIGLTEETDAIVVVVSEETGSISYAHQGQLVRGVTLEQLRAFLTSLLVKKSRPQTFFDWIRGWRSEKISPSPAVKPKEES